MIRFGVLMFALAGLPGAASANIVHCIGMDGMKSRNLVSDDFQMADWGDNTTKHLDAPTAAWLDWLRKNVRADFSKYDAQCRDFGNDPAKAEKDRAYFRNGGLGTQGYMEVHWTPPANLIERSSSQPKATAQNRAKPVRQTPEVSTADEDHDAQEEARLRQQLAELNARADARIRAERDRAERIAAEDRARKQQYAAALALNERQVEAARQAKARHEAQLAENRRQQEEYQRKLAEHQALVTGKKAEAEARRKAAEEEANRLVNFPEGVVLCEQNSNDGQSKFGNWRCTGPLQMTYAKLDTPNAKHALGQACGNNGGNLRVIGSTSGYRAFGCGYGINPGSQYPGNRDVPKDFGVVVAGRTLYRCKASVSAYCTGQ